MGRHRSGPGDGAVRIPESWVCMMTNPAPLQEIRRDIRRGQMMTRGVRPQTLMRRGVRGVPLVRGRPKCGRYSAGPGQGEGRPEISGCMTPRCGLARHSKYGAVVKWFNNRAVNPLPLGMGR